MSRGRRAVGGAALLLSVAAISFASTSGPTPLATWEVWVCRVPPGTSAEPYVRSPLGSERVPLAPDVLARQFEAEITPWFTQVSYGRYRPLFRTGSEVRLEADHGPAGCLDRVEQARRRREVRHSSVIAVADVVHPDDEPGGFTRGQSVYVGAVDFHPGWTDGWRFDLVEHELGHALGWGHSAVEGSRYLSAIDLMSDSGGLRQWRPEARHAPPPSAVHRAAIGWIPPDDVVTVLPDADDASATVAVHPASASEGVRLLRVPAGRNGWLSVELIDDPLAPGLGPGLAIHHVQDAIGWRMQPMVGEAPFTDLLGDGESWRGHGWVVTAERSTPTWLVTVVHDRTT